MSTLVDSDIQRFVACLVLGKIEEISFDFLKHQQQSNSNKYYRISGEPAIAKDIHVVL